MRSTLLLVLLLTAILPPATARQLPVKAFAQLPDTRNIELSPNGENILTLVRSDAEGYEGTAVTVYNLKEKASKILILARNERFKINWVRWANNRKILISARYPANRYGVDTTETRLLVMDIKTQKKRGIFSNRYMRRAQFISQIQDGVVDILPDEPNKILLKTDMNTPLEYRVVKIDLERGSMKTVQSAYKDIRAWYTDRQHRVRVGWEIEDNIVTVYGRDSDDKKYRTLWEYENLSADDVTPIGFGHDPDELYVTAYQEGRSAIFKVNLKDPDLKKHWF